ncbi:unnamed protein product [Clavelina lepadiformis]|uniref:C2H2-type domain-containing protein n=1 Tax=Clavelina lepadiformis TaxID=159417 RepID=A0ABP0G3Q3_CLALP
MQVDDVLKAISDLILQELKSMKQDMKMEFSKMQENMENMYLKFFAETTKAETMNNDMQVEKTLQPLNVQSDTGICIQEVHSEKTSVFPHLEEDCLSLQDWEVSQFETGDTISPTTNNVVSQSENKGNVTHKNEIVDSENINERIPHVDCKVSPILQTETDGTITSLSYNIVLQSENEANATLEDEIVDSENLTERNSHVEYNISAKEFPDKNTTNNERNKVNCSSIIVKNDKRKHFCCTVCAKSFTKKSNMKRHLKTHTGTRLYQCEVCSKSFSLSSNLQRHMKVHSGERPYKCKVCCKSFSDSSDLKRHMKVHTGERPYECEICFKSFSQSSHLQLHMKVDNGERPYQCKVCCKSFLQSNTLRNHLKIHTGERPYQCKVCFKSFSQSGIINAHMRTHTGERPHHCDICFKSFSRTTYLQTHMKVHTRERTCH